MNVGTDIAAGTVVRRKLDILHKRPMTVEGFNEVTGRVKVLWFEGAGLHYGEYMPMALTTQFQVQA